MSPNLFFYYYFSDAEPFEFEHAQVSYKSDRNCHLGGGGPQLLQEPEKLSQYSD
jgi:hypothetical protein